MTSTSPFTLKIASEDWEFEQIHALNYQTFVEEVPQHPATGTRTLVDKFHAENTYLICLRDRQLVGMMAVRDKRPFSLDLKLPDLDSYLPEARSVCEIRLLSVHPDHRTGVVFRSLGTLLLSHCRAKGYDLAVVSGTLRQQQLYRHLGFVPFGPVVGAPGPLFQPMYLTWSNFGQNSASFVPAARKPRPDDPALDERGRQPRQSEALNLLPGPVSINAEVRQALAAPVMSHRSDGFRANLDRTRELLRELTGADRVEILLGSGTLANDVVAAQLSLEAGRGLVLANGEFGERLIDHATRQGLSFEALRVPWGVPFDPAEVGRLLKSSPDVTWLWGVHCETSTGMLNDLKALKAVSSRTGVKLCLDCISSIGSVPVDLRGVYLATGVSGKALGGFPGLSMVYYDHPVAPSGSLPRYLDLGLYAFCDGVPFTHSSNLLSALRAALERLNHRPSSGPRDKAADVAAWLRSSLRDLGLELVTADAHATPGVITIALDGCVSSRQLGARLEGAWISTQLPEPLPAGTELDTDMPHEPVLTRRARSTRGAAPRSVHVSRLSNAPSGHHAL